MAFLRKQTSEGSIGLLYSVIQKCMRRGMEEECLYYSRILFNEGTPNSLRKRLVYITNEDIGHIELSNEIVECSDEDLFKYVAICCRLKKTHDTAWLSRLSLHYSMNKIVPKSEEMIESVKMTECVRREDFKSIREYIGKKYCKLYSFSGRNNLVWAAYIMFNRRPELNQEYSLDIELLEPRKFVELPFWVKDKHVSGGTSGYKFFFDNSLVVNENIYGLEGDRYATECKKVYLDDEENLGNGKTKVLYKKWKEQIEIDIENEKTDVEDAGGSFEKKIPGFKDVVQVQLITSRGKPQVYFATSLEDGKKYVLKGPIEIKMRKQIMRSEIVKKTLDMNHLNVEFINLFGQNWMKSDSLLDYDFTKKELKSSKIETNVYIYNGVNNNYNFDNINEDNFMDLFENFMFRLVIGANDHCARNFITDGNKVYSIDDHCLEEDFESISIRIMKKEIKVKWFGYLVIHEQKVYEILNKWGLKIKNEGMLSRIEKLKTYVEKIKNE